MFLQETQDRRPVTAQTGTAESANNMYTGVVNEQLHSCEGGEGKNNDGEEINITVKCRAY